MYIHKIALTVCLRQLYTNKCLSEQEDIPEAWVRWRVGAGQWLMWTARHKYIFRQYILPVVICQSQSCFPPTSRMFGSFATDAGTPDASPLPPSCQFCISWRDWVRHAEGAANIHLLSPLCFCLSLGNITHVFCARAPGTHLTLSPERRVTFTF